MIEKVTKYKFEGKEYDSLNDIKAQVVDKIGKEIIDQINKKVSIRHRDLFVLMEILCEPKNREVLSKYLNVTFTRYEEEWDTDDQDYREVEKTINVLDLQ